VVESSVVLSEVSFQARIGIRAFANVRVRVDNREPVWDPVLHNPHLRHLPASEHFRECVQSHRAECRATVHLIAAGWSVYLRVQRVVAEHVRQDDLRR
jgi:hypothetical protein